jgi:hypothetical protein
MVNILRLTVAYLNATINVKPEKQNRRLEPTGLAKPVETRGLTGTGPGLARQESAGRVSGRFWNRTDPFLRSKPGLLAGYPDPLLTIVLLNNNVTFDSLKTEITQSPTSHSHVRFPIYTYLVAKEYDIFEKSITLDSHFDQPY